MKRTLPLLLLLAACASSQTQHPLIGTWEMVSHMQGNAMEATMTLDRDEDGALVGNWSSRGREMELSGITVSEDTLEFDREIPSGDVLHFSGTFTRGAIEGTWTGSFGEIDVDGAKLEQEAPGNEERSVFHSRPIKEENGQSLLWANDEEWFDVTDSKIDPSTFQYGIGKDTIPSIDEPEFVRFSDPRVAAAEITRETPVLGVVINGEARAYPVELMDGHEIVNDQFGDEAYAILW